MKTFKKSLPTLLGEREREKNMARQTQFFAPEEISKRMVEDFKTVAVADLGGFQGFHGTPPPC